MNRIIVLVALFLLALPFSLVQGERGFEMLYWFGPAGGYPGEKGVKVPVFYAANREVETFTLEMEIDSTKLSFADTAAIKGALIDSVCPEPFLWEVDVNGNHLYVSCFLSMTGGIALPAESEEVPLLQILLDVNPDLTPPDSTILDIKDIEFYPATRYYGIDGTFYIHKEGCKEPPGYSQPYQFELEQNYPNPFNASTNIRYYLPTTSYQQQSAVSLKVFNLLGQEVKTLVDERQRTGLYRIVWDGKDGEGRDVGSGIYFCRLEVEDKRLKVVKTRKFVLLR